MSATETLEPPVIQQPEQEAHREHLTQEEVERAFAQIALILALESMLGEEDEHLFTKEQTAPTPEPAASDKKFDTTSGAEIFSLLNYKFSTAGNKKPATSFVGQGQPQFDYSHLVTDLGAYRTHSYVNAPSEPKPDFTPAPSMASEPLGPQLPSLGFENRVRPVGEQPSTAQFAAADRANDMYQRALFDKGWRGGEVTPEQAKKAGRAMQREYHPDLPTTSQPDVDAITAYNSHNAKPTTPGEKGPEPAPANAPTKPMASADPNAAI